jgi:hypothetical protein
VEVVLVETSEEKYFVLFDRSADCSSALLLAALWLECHEGIARPERAVANVIKASAMPMIGPRLGNHVDHGTAGASKFRSV